MIPMRGAACAGAWLVMIAVSACTPIERQPSTRKGATVDPVCVEAARPVPEGTVITTLQTRDHEVTVYAARAGLRFTVAAAGGIVLAQQLSEIEFAESFPGLHSRYDSAFAGDRSWIDASAERASLPEPDAGL
jgi:hypothetical protein